MKVYVTVSNISRFYLDAVTGKGEFRCGKPLGWKHSHLESRQLLRFP